MRGKAANGSPCDPVARQRTSDGGTRFHLGIADDGARAQLQVAEALRRLRGLQHAASDERDLAAELIGQVAENLHAIHARRKCRHHELSGRGRENFLERVLHLQLRPGESLAVDVRAVGKQRQHAGAPELREAMHVEVLAVDRRLIDLEISRVHDRARRRMNGHCHAIGHAVRDAQELHFAVAHANALARLNGDEAVAWIDPVLLELRPQERQRQRRRVDRSVDERPEIGNPADVILVPVRQHQRRRPWLALLEIREVRNEQVDPGQFRAGKHHTRIDHERGLIRRDGHRVHAEFAEPSERDHCQRWMHRLLETRAATMRPGGRTVCVRITVMRR